MAVDKRSAALAGLERVNLVLLQPDLDVATNGQWSSLPKLR